MNSKINGKVNARLRYFTSQISTIPGPKDVGNSQMADELGKERRDNLVFNDDKFKLRHGHYLSSYYQDSKFKTNYQPGKEYESYKKETSEKLENRKTTHHAAVRRHNIYHKETKIY